MTLNIKEISYTDRTSLPRFQQKCHFNFAKNFETNRFHKDLHHAILHDQMHGMAVFVKLMSEFLEESKIKQNVYIVGKYG